MAELSLAAARDEIGLLSLREGDSLSVAVRLFSDEGGAQYVTGRSGILHERPSNCQCDLLLTLQCNVIGAGRVSGW